MQIHRSALIALVGLACLACHGAAPSAGRPSSLTPEAISLFGEPLVPQALPPEVRADREVKLAEARAAVDRSPGDADALIWLGRRTAYLGRYQAAIRIFSQGIEKYPGDARFYRHRGHRYITVRELDRAVADLETAGRLTAGKPDEIEPDGLPNARNIPTSTLQSNVWYHLGLARYLKGDLAGALTAYQECLKVSSNPDMLVATSHWLYMTLRRLGREDEARRVLEPIHAGMDIIENQAYYRLLLMYKGELSTEDLATGASGDLDRRRSAMGSATGTSTTGAEKRRSGVSRRSLPENWPAFGYIAAEADLKRLGEAPR
jgi:tetratricopeptide (TPR) repeat protein